MIKQAEFRFPFNIKNYIIIFKIYNLLLSIIRTNWYLLIIIICSFNSGDF